MTRVFFLLLLSGLQNLQAQTNTLNFGMKLGFLSGGSYLSSQKAVFYNQGTSGYTPNVQMSMWFNTAMTKRFRIGTEIGFIERNTLIKTKYVIPGGYESEIDARLLAQQLYWALVPEFRIKPYFFVNAGIGYFHDIRDEFTEGTIIKAGQFIALQDAHFTRVSNAGYFLGAGLCPKIPHTNIGLLVDIRYLFCPAGNFLENGVYIGSKGFNLGFGLTYNPE